MHLTTDHFRNLKMAPPDSILSVDQAYKEDRNSEKMDFGVAAYRNEKGGPHVFKVVRKALDEVLADPEHDFEYLPIEGLTGFCEESRKFAFGADDPFVKEGKIATVQTPGGTGALRVGFDFLKLFMKGDVYISDPTWETHKSIVEKAGLKHVEYPYLKKGTFDFDFDSMYNTFSQAPHGSIIILHQCAHNPTGVDPTMDQWKKLAKLVKEKGLFPFFDSALHGWASGSLQKDREPMEIFLKEGLQLMVAQSFSKTLGLYGERVGALHVVCSDHDTVERVLSQLKLIVRPMYSNAPAIGGRIAWKVLENPQYVKQWQEEFELMFKRVRKMRQELYDEIQEIGIKGNWDHLVKQTGMFFYTGLSKKQCQVLTEKHHAYVTESGRMTVSGLNEGNLKRFARALKDVVDNYGDDSENTTNDI